MNEKKWQTAHKMAIQLVENETDVNEFSKFVSYLRSYCQIPNGGQKFFSYVTTLAKQDKVGQRSKKTPEYYKSISNTCEQFLKEYQDDTAVMLQILAWVDRLVRYYKSLPTGEFSEKKEEIESTPVVSQRQAEIAEVVASQDIEVGQNIEAQVVAIKGHKVTYEILNTIRLTEREPKKANKLSEGENVMVKVTDLKDDGSIKKVKYTD
jgi:hypothetical protein